MSAEPAAARGAPAAGPVRVPAPAIRGFIGDALAAVQRPAGDAARIAELMTEADLTGADAHGVFRLPQYVRRLRAGGVNLLIPNPRDMPGFIKELMKYQVNAFPAVNTLYNGLLHSPGFDQVDFSKLKISNGGGMAVSQALTRIIGVDVPLLGEVPIDMRLREAGDDGLPVVLAAPRAPAAFR